MEAEAETEEEEVASWRRRARVARWYRTVAFGAQFVKTMTTMG